MFLCRSQRGEFCEPPHGGASARTAKAGFGNSFLRKPNTEQQFPLPQPRCRQFCTSQSAAELRTIQNCSLSAAFIPAIAYSTCCGPPHQRRGHPAGRRPLRTLLVFVALCFRRSQRGLPALLGQRGDAAVQHETRQRHLRALRPASTELLFHETKPDRTSF